MALSASSVLNRKARVRSPGASAAVTASAVVRRSSRSGSERRLSATSRATCSPGAVPARQLDLDRRGQLLEQARPGARAGERLLGEDLLLGLAEQVLAVAAHVAQVVAAEVQPLAREQLLGALVCERGPLQLEEQQRGLDRGLLLLHALQQRPVGRVGGVGGEAQRGVVAGAARQLLDPGELAPSPPAGPRCRARRARPRSARRRPARARAPARAGARRPPGPRRRRAARDPRRSPPARGRPTRRRLRSPSCVSLERRRRR